MEMKPKKWYSFENVMFLFQKLGEIQIFKMDTIFLPNNGIIKKSQR